MEGRRRDVTNPVGSKDYFHTLFVVQLKVVKTGPRLHIVKLCYSAVNIYRRDDDVRIICEKKVMTFRTGQNL